MPIRRSSPGLGALVLAALVWAPALVHAEDYLPLAIGNRWTYKAPGGGGQVLTVTGTKELLGRTVYVISYTGNPANEGLENYWISGDDGFVLCGFLRTLDSWGIAYEPPIRVLGLPASVGQQFVTVTTALHWPDYVVGDPLTIGFEVVEDVDLGLPAGTFRAFGLGQFIPASFVQGSKSVGADGTARPSGIQVNAGEWYSAGVGEVQFNSDNFYQLASYDLPTPVVTSSWGRLKRLYR